MGDGCSCDDPELVAAKDRSMEPIYISGNPYSRYCLGCGRRYFCKDTFWENADEKYVIPKDGDEPVHVDDYDEENFFECPECGQPHFGTPDDCDSCGAEYAWED
jgi:hypothetical protein